MVVPRSAELLRAEKFEEKFAALVKAAKACLVVKQATLFMRGVDDRSAAPLVTRRSNSSP